MTLTENSKSNEPETKKLLNVQSNANSNNHHHQDQHKVSSFLEGISDNADSSRPREEPDVIIEMVSSRQTTVTDDLSHPDICTDGNDTNAVPDSDRDSDDNDEDIFESAWVKHVERVQNKVYAFFNKWRGLMARVVKVTLFVAYLAFVAYCMWYKFGDEESYRLLGFTLFAVCVIIKRNLLSQCYCISLANFTEFWGGTLRTRRVRYALKWLLRAAVIISFIVFLIIDILKNNPENIQSLIGLILFVIILFFTSYNPAKVNWHTVFWGLALQWILALIILRTLWGQAMFKWIGDRVHEFLNFGLKGAEFVFGSEYYRHRLAMVTVSVMLFFNSVIFILFHLGTIQTVINSFGRFLGFCLDTNPIESFAASANIFVSLTEAPLMLRPYLNQMTKSELYTVMTCGFASISGGVLGIYVQLGIPANHLLTASVMSAPAALAISKLMCPETKRSKLNSVKSDKICDIRYRNVLQAASSGAVQAVPIAVATLANQISFVSLLAFFNSVLQWMGKRSGFTQLSFKWLCSYLFYPLVYAMGTEAGDCLSVGSLLGIKLFGTPIISYTALENLRNNRLEFESYLTAYPNASWQVKGDDIFLEFTNTTLFEGVISERSEVIATYMLCGFSTITSIGVCLGVLLPLAQERKDDIVNMVVHALMAGNFASFFTAGIAGLMFNGRPLPS